MQQPDEFGIDALALAMDSTPADRFVYTPTFVVYEPFTEDDEPAQPDGETTETPASPPPLLSTVPPSEQLAALVESQLGLVFLDRTRIRPRGFALGELVYSRSLAPGEQVPLEQNTYPKRETSSGQATELEQTFDTEMSSAFTTELNEGMTTDHSRGGTDTTTMGVNVGSNTDGTRFNIGPTSCSSVTDADKTTTTESLKNSQAASARAAARNRSQHEIAFEISTETRFETTSRRTIRNPNLDTPIGLSYFQVMQRLELSHERYGVRLCWAPAVPNPGGELWARLERTRREIYYAAWEAAGRQAKADAKAAADEQWAAHLKDALAKSDPMLETVGAVIRAMLPAPFRKNIWTIDFWEDLFDWRNAVLRLHPSWRASSELRKPDGQPTDFVSASWVRLCLPIAPGAETAALRWIYERRISDPASSSAERLISKIVKELSTYRKANFGPDQELQGTSGADCPTVSEEYVCLGRWHETLPTDRTHLEVLQAASSAAGDYSREEFADADALRHEQIERIKRENPLHQKAETQGTGELSTETDVDSGVEPSQ